VFKSVIDIVQRDHPIVTGFTPRFQNEDHTSLQQIKCCSECNPYRTSATFGPKVPMTNNESNVFEGASTLHSRDIF